MEGFKISSAFTLNYNINIFFFSLKFFWDLHFVNIRIARPVGDNFKKIIENLNLNVPFNVTCHTLRHSFASHLNDEEVDILVIQDLLGHATPKTTADYYIHPSEKKVREALEKLPGVIYMNQLIQSGLLKFQSPYFKRE
ncbi:tyrosine-type recombinase/integrase [candidate division KSB1 bacterium]|nr:tyrosine-type recombinase/integrase [candidate division KSB1 bacterium]